METFLALLRDQFHGARAACRGVDETRLARALHSDWHFRNVWIGRACRQGGRTDQAVQSLCGIEGRIRHVSRIRSPLPQIPDEYRSSVERLLPGPAPAPRDAESDLVRAHRQ